MPGDAENKHGGFGEGFTIPFPGHSTLGMRTARSLRGKPRGEAGGPTGADPGGLLAGKKDFIQHGLTQSITRAGVAAPGQVSGSPAGSSPCPLSPAQRAEPPGQDRRGGCGRDREGC